MRIGIVDVFVDDQDRARDFYTAILGMEVNVDAAYGGSGRWLTVVSPQDRDGTALLLAPLNEAAKALQAARRDSGTPAVSFTTDDCQRSYRELLERGPCSCPSLGRWATGESTPCSRTAAATCSTCTKTPPPQPAPKPRMRKEASWLERWQGR